MILYSILIIFFMALVSLLNFFFNPMYQDKPWLYFILVTAFTVLVILIDGVVAFIVRKLPEKWFSQSRGFLKTSKWELKFFNFLKVQKWKDHVPELGSFTGFHKNKVVDPFDNEYIARFILEARYGVAIHYLSVPTSLLILLADYRLYLGQSNIWLTVALPVALVNMVLIVLPAFILKYNLPKLERIYAANLRKKNKSESKEETKEKGC